MSPFLVFFLLLAGYVLFKHYRDLKDFPPGPPKLPWVGCLFSVLGLNGSRIVMESTKMVPKYGNIIGFVIGKEKLVIISDFKLAKEIAFSDRFAGRAVNHYHTNIRGYGVQIGVITTEGEKWRNIRRFALKTLKEFGFGKKSMSGIIAEEGQEAMKMLQGFHGRDFEVHQTFNIPIFNIIWRIVGGRRYQHDDPHIRGLQLIMEGVFKHAFKDRPFPLLSKLFPSLFHVPEKVGHAAAMKAMFEEVVEEHRVRQREEDQPPGDFIDVYLREMGADSTLTYHDLIGLCMDFFEAGGETVGSTMAWVLQYLALHQEEQEKCYKEIKDTIGEKVPTLEDKPLLPYCEATMMEIQRFACTAPASLDHKSMDDAWIGGYKIPKDANVFYNIHKFHADPEFWGDPEVFRPGRFLSKDEAGKTKVANFDYFMPFGFGRRVCLGESLAKAELFIFTVLLIQTLRITLPKDHPAADPNDDNCGITRGPKPFYVHVESRLEL